MTTIATFVTDYGYPAVMEIHFGNTTLSLPLDEVKEAIASFEKQLAATFGEKQ